MPHLESCTDRGELGIADDGSEFCMNCGETIKFDEDSVIIQEKFLSEKPKKPKSLNKLMNIVEKFEELDEKIKETHQNSKKRKTFDEIFNERIIPILHQYWMKHQIKIDLPTKSGHFYIYLTVSYLDFDDLKKFDKDIGKHGWYLMSIVKQAEGFALRCKT